jgi:hypothetical protein
MRNLLMISVFTLLFVHSTAASDWELFVDGQNDEYYIDKQSIEVYAVNCSWHVCTNPQIDFALLRDLPKKFVRVWVKKTTKKPGKYDATEEMDYLEYECNERSARLLHLTKVYPNMVNESVDLSEIPKWSNIKRDAVLKLLYEYLCKNKKYMATSPPEYRAAAQIR